MFVFFGNYQHSLAVLTCIDESLTWFSPLTYNLRLLFKNHTPSQRKTAAHRREE